MSAVGSSRAASAPDVRRVFISYKRSVEPDTSLASFLYEALTNRGHRVFMDVKRVGHFNEFEDPIDGAITSSDFFIVVVTRVASKSRMIAAETELAVDSEANTGHPRVLPVRAAYTEGLGLRIRAAIGHLNHFEWRDSADNERLLAAILDAMAERPEPPPSSPPLPPSKPPSAEPPDTVLPKPAPVEGDLSTSEHLIGRSLWQLNRARQVLGGTMLVGVAAGEETSLSATRAAGLGFFRVRIVKDGALEVAIWSGATYRRVQSRPGEFIRIMQGDTHGWCFARHGPDESVLLGPPSENDKPIAVRFDTAIVKAAWSIVHKRTTAEEKFLIVMKDPQA
jgi:TIR domain